MNPNRFSKITEEIQAMLPQWMRMAKDKSSIGAQFLNVFGLEFEDVEAYVDEAIKNIYIGSADLNQVDVLYKASIPNIANVAEGQVEVSVIKDDMLHAVQVVGNIRAMYSAGPEENVAIFDRERAYLYIRLKRSWMEETLEKPISHFLLNKLPYYEYNIHHVWNSLDELGLLLGLYRLRGELNSAFKERILDVFKNPANATKQGIINGLSRDLGIDPSLVTLNELSDPAFRQTLINDDGTPSKKLVQIAKQTNDLLGSTWGNMSWDEAYWHSIENEQVGLDYLPHIWDAPMHDWKDEDFQSGVGSESDLQVRAPEKLSNERDFKYYVGLRGKERGTDLIYPELSFKYKISAKGRIENEAYTPEEFKYTVVSSEVIRLYYIIRGYKTYFHDTSILFDGIVPITYDSPTDANCEIVTGLTVAGLETNNFLQIEAELQTTDPKQTSVLNSFDVVWQDSAGGTHTLGFTTQADFDRFDDMVQTNKLDVFTTAAGDVELGYGEFYAMIDTREDFLKGKTMENVLVTKEGSVKLVPFTE